MRKITQKEMLELYEEDLIDNIVTVGSRVLAHNYKGQVDNPKRYEVVYCELSLPTTSKALEVVRKPVSYTKDKIVSMVLKIVERFTER